MGYRYSLIIVQEIKQTSDELIRLLAGHEKEEVGLIEKKKHSAGKGKKLKKALQEVGSKILRQQGLHYAGPT